MGAGTFKPVKAQTMATHEMHGEQIEVSAETIHSIIHYLDSNVIAIGTTSLRTIESLYWIGVKMINANKKFESRITSDKHIVLDQWEPYEINEGIKAKDALTEVLNWLKKNKKEILQATTRIIIAPGYKPRIASALVTNFHQPQSTLLLLVAALIGDDWRTVYNYALANDFRFLSYGDGCLLWFGK